MADKAKGKGKPPPPAKPAKPAKPEPAAKGKPDAKGKEEPAKPDPAAKGKEPEPDKAKTPEGEKEPKKTKSPQPKDEVGTRKKCRRYRWELKSSNKEFWVMGHAEVKYLSVGLLVTALILFNGLSVHPILILIVVLELAIFIFLIIVYTFAISRYTSFILWPIADLLNDLVAVAFLAWAVYFAVTSRPTMHMHYFIAVVCCGIVALLSLIDVCLQRRHFTGKRVKKNVLVPPPPKEKPPEKGKEPDAKKPGQPDANKPKEPAANKPKEPAANKPKEPAAKKEPAPAPGKK